jgi:hypothetical protein
LLGPAKWRANGTYSIKFFGGEGKSARSSSLTVQTMQVKEPLPLRPIYSAIKLRRRLRWYR